MVLKVYELIGIEATFHKPAVLARFSLSTAASLVVASVHIVNRGGCFAAIAVFKKEMHDLFNLKLKLSQLFADMK